MTTAETPAGAAKTPAEHRAKAESDLRFLGNYGPGDAAYHGYALSAIARLFAVLVAYLEPQPLPQVPGLPPGWRIETQSRDSESGTRWAYSLTAPDGTHRESRYLWNTSESALGAGILAAQDDAGSSGRPENRDQGGVTP